MGNNENMNNQVNENNVQEEKKNNNKKTIGIVILVIGLLLVVFAGYKLFIQKDEEPKGNNGSIPTTTPTDNNQQGNDEKDNILDSEDSVVFEGEKLTFVLKGDTIYTYDINKKLVSEKKYDKVVRGSDESRGYIALVYESNNCYLLDETGKSVKLSLDNNYKNSNSEILIYKQNEDKYYVVIGDTYYLTDMDLAMYENDDTYGSICLDPDHMICSGTLLVNIKTKEILAHGDFDISKTSNGYFFVDNTYERDSLADEPYTIEHATRIFTDKKIEINEKGMYTFVNDKIVVESNGGLAEYDINGKKTRSLTCDDVYGIGEKFAFVKKGNKNYLVNLKNEFSMKEIQISDSINIKYVYEVDEKEMIFSTGEGDTYEEFYQKYNFATGKVESAISSNSDD